MSTVLLERTDSAVDTQPKAAESDDLDHVICHCDLTKGWCGAPVTDGLDETQVGVDCPECEALLLEHEEVCPHGCSCPASMRYWYCGIDDMDDEEDEDE